MKRAPGTGSITQVRNGFWARLWVEGRKVSLGVHPTEDVAAGVLDEAIHARGLRGGSAGGRLTFATFARQVLDIRESDDVRAIYSERRRFARHLENCEIAHVAIGDVSCAQVLNVARTIARKDAADLRGRRKLSRQTVQRCMAVVRAVFAEAVMQGHRADNPCIGVKLKTRATDEDTEEKWDWLRGPEQQAVLACEKIPEWARVMMRFAWGTGLRQGEQWNLELRDLHVAGEDPHVFVRFGSRGKPPKNGRMRKVPLFGEGLAAARRWLEMLPTYAKENPFRLVFPGPTGARRSGGAPSTSRRVDGKVAKVELLPLWLSAAGLQRSVRWHDLRHTCGSSLASGVWGPVWDLHMIKDVLGHSSIKVTEKYSHLSEHALRTAGSTTTAWVTAGVTGNGPGASSVAVIRNDSEMVGRAGLEPATYGLKEPVNTEIKRGFTSVCNPVVTPERQDRARALLEAVASGDRARALALAVTLAAEDVTVESSEERERDAAC